MERHVFELLHKTICALLGNTLALFPSQLVNVMDSSRLEETVACHQSFRLAGKPGSATTGYVYRGRNGVSPPPPKNRAGVCLFEEPHKENFQYGEKGIVCAILPGTTGEMFNEAEIDSVLHQDGTYSLKRRSQCLELVQFPTEILRTTTMQELREKIQMGLNQIFGDSNMLLIVPSTRPLTDPSQIQAYDVLCDRNDERAPKHYGNRKFALVVAASKSKYKNLRMFPEKRADVAKTIVQTIRKCEPGGRFLAKTKSGTWKDIGDGLAVRWVGLILEKTVATSP